MTAAEPHQTDGSVDLTLSRLESLSIREIRSLASGDTAAVTQRLVRHARAVTSSMGGHNAGGDGFDYSDTAPTFWERQALSMRDIKRPEPNDDNDASDQKEDPERTGP